MPELLASWLDRHRLPEHRAPQEREIELEVSRYLGAMPFLWLAVADRFDGTIDRDYIERNTIALLSCLTSAADQPSPGWLGHDASHYDPGLLQIIAKHVQLMH
ncbi:MAG: hypothetical protein ABI112_12180 [Terracoccus sp.]